VSDWKASVARRRTARAEGAGEDAPRPAPAKKAHKGRWCRGRAGVPHTFERRPYHGWSGKNPVEADICAACGKIGRIHWPPLARLREKRD
jgi:hypothetical protein